MFDFGKANPNTAPTTNDQVGNAGLLMSDVAAIAGKSPLATGTGFVGSMMLGASELRSGNIGGGLGDLGSGALNAAAAVPAISQHIPGLGVAAGVTSAIGHGAEAWRHRDEINKGYQNNQFWSEAGWATIGGLNAAAALDPTGTSSLIVGGGELLLDGLGAAAGAIGGQDYAFNAGSAIGGAEHLLFDTGQAIASGASSAIHGAGTMLSNAGTSISNGMSTAGTAISNGVSSAGNAISNGWHWLMGDSTPTSAPARR